MIARLAVAEVIAAYQRYVSPHKGFCCAHHALHHRGSCSTFGKRVVLRFGVLRFFSLMWRRLKSCRAAYQVLLTEARQRPNEGEPLVIDGREYKDCPLRPTHLMSKECGYCGYLPFYCLWG